MKTKSSGRAHKVSSCHLTYSFLFLTVVPFPSAPLSVTMSTSWKHASPYEKPLFHLAIRTTCPLPSERLRVDEIGSPCVPECLHVSACRASSLSSCNFGSASLPLNARAPVLESQTSVTRLFIEQSDLLAYYTYHRAALCLQPCTVYPAVSPYPVSDAEDTPARRSRVPLNTEAHATPCDEAHLRPATGSRSVQLTRVAVHEFDRRNLGAPQITRPITRSISTTALCQPVVNHWPSGKRSDLQCFARHGGPDMSDLMIVSFWRHIHLGANTRRCRRMPASQPQVTKVPMT